MVANCPAPTRLKLYQHFDSYQRAAIIMRRGALFILAWRIFCAQAAFNRTFARFIAKLTASFMLATGFQM